ncbi:hypothetical protein [uncultured Albimonas sp.]|uniref:hypothetical protein n=1 Tax=uncultured Albimonas sp. TaxID=1331701 RepID=UPI0030EEB96C|tara:strand:- start:5887 stop:6327 length:441 start_codon:yes stop_codon:yes gene_type:complete
MTLTRRTALAAPALLALPSAALARQVEPDPFVSAFLEWRKAYKALNTYSYAAEREDDDPEYCRLLNEAIAAEKDLAVIVPTTPAGLALMTRAALQILDPISPAWGIPADVFDWSPEHFLLDNEFERRVATFAFNMIAAAEAMAGRA